MKNFKRFMMVMIVTVFSVALVGCGVSKEEHDKTVSELNKTKSELAQANARLAEMDKQLNEAKTQLESAAKAPETIEEKSEVVEKPLTEDKGMQDKLAVFEKEALDLREQVKSLTSENSRLNELLETLKAQLSALKQKLGGLQTPSTSLPSKELPADIVKKKF